MTQKHILCCILNNQKSIYPPASKASREVANLTERKNPHTPYMVSKNIYKRLFDLSSNQNQKRFEKSM